MNILMMLNAPWVGGTRIHVLTLAGALIERGHRLVLVTDPGFLEEEMAGRGITFVPRVEGFRPMLDLLLALADKEKPDIIHAHPAASILEGFHLARMTGLPLVVTMHGEYLMHFQRDRPAREICQTVRTVIAVSQGVRDYLVANSALSPAQLTVIPNGIDTREFRPGLETSPLRRELGLRDDEAAIVYLGRLDADKKDSILAAAEAMGYLAKYGVKARGVFVGAGDLLPMLEERRRRLRLETRGDRLLLTGFRRDLPGLLSLAETVIAAGRSALEAMAVGKPVLASGRAGYLGLVTRGDWPRALAANFGDHGVLPAPNPVLLADELHHLHARADLRGLLGRELRGLVERDFSLREVAARTEAVYRAAVSSGCHAS
ncbi:MAG: glycosyltransferase [Patescibacteria group bacterium]